MVNFSAGSYALASGLRGFASSTLRVRVSEVRDGCAWIRTADLLDSGTPLTISEGQLSPEGAGDHPTRHRDGLIILQG